MFFRRKKNLPISCPVSVIFEIMKDDLELGICCNIDFTYKNKKHQTGVWGDDGETKKNVVYYLDKQSFSSIEELMRAVVEDGISLSELTDPILITECDGCYPRNTPQLEPYA